MGDIREQTALCRCTEPHHWGGEQCAGPATDVASVRQGVLARLTAARSDLTHITVEATADHRDYEIPGITISIPDAELFAAILRTLIVVDGDDPQTPASSETGAGPDTLGSPPQVAPTEDEVTAAAVKTEPEDVTATTSEGGTPATTRPPIVTCPTWCTVTQQEHLDNMPWAEGNAIHDRFTTVTAEDGKHEVYVGLGQTTTLAGDTDGPDLDGKPYVDINGHVYGHDAVSQLVDALTHARQVVAG